MPKFRVVTESGTVYHIDTDSGFWQRNDEYHNRIFTFEVSNIADPDLPWVDPEGWEPADAPVIGKRMYLSNFDEWVISTKVISIEIDERETNDVEVSQ